MVQQRKRGQSLHWRRKQEEDPYLRRARAEGFRSRAVYKLQEIDRRHRLLRPGLCVVDLGAAPGSWSQWAARRVRPGGRVIALDRAPIEPIPGVELLTGDFFEDQVEANLRNALSGRAVDLVLSDIAPNSTGVKITDTARSEALAEHAAEFAAQVLHPGGNLLVKIFQGGGFEALRRRLQNEYRKVNVCKPKSSRPESREVFLLARERRL